MNLNIVKNLIKTIAIIPSFIVFLGAKRVSNTPFDKGYRIGIYLFPKAQK